MNPLRVTVFGGSSPKAGERAYQEAQQLGKMLGAEGYTVLTGGYIGTMEAVSHGAAEAGGHVVGVTCDEIEAWRAVKPNRWVQEEWRFPTVRERLFTLIERCEAAFALPGGVGTLAEISVMWNQMQTAAIPTRPLILIGEGWERTFERFFNDLEDYVPAQHCELLTFAPDPDNAFRLLKDSFNNR